MNTDLLCVVLDFLEPGSAEEVHVLEHLLETKQANATMARRVAGRAEPLFRRACRVGSVRVSKWLSSNVDAGKNGDGASHAFSGAHYGLAEWCAREHGHCEKYNYLVLSALEDGWRRGEDRSSMAARLFGTSRKAIVDTAGYVLCDVLWEEDLLKAKRVAEVAGLTQTNVRRAFRDHSAFFEEDDRERCLRVARLHADLLRWAARK